MMDDLDQLPQSPDDEAAMLALESGATAEPALLLPAPEPAKPPAVAQLMTQMALEDAAEVAQGSEAGEPVVASDEAVTAA